MIFTSHYMLIHTQPTHRKTCLAHSSLFNSVSSGDFYLCPAKSITALLLGKCHHTWIRKIYLGGLFEGEEPEYLVQYCSFSASGDTWNLVYF